MDCTTIQHIVLFNTEGNCKRFGIKQTLVTDRQTVWLDVNSLPWFIEAENDSEFEKNNK